MEKTCKDCNKTKPIDEFYNYRRNSDGKSTYCKDCTNARHKEYTERHVEELRAWRNGRRDKFAKAARRYRTKHPERKAKASSEWHKGRREINLARMKQWATENKERRAISKRKWRQENPDKVAAEKQRRYARVHAVLCSLTPEQAFAIKHRGCFFCGATKNLAIAHDIAVSQKGNTTLANTFCLCARCNSSMGTKPLAEMITQLTLLLTSEVE